ncbi:MAG: hypothetical protein ACLFNV_10960 [Desulfovibrionales bacterium]
MQSRAFRMIFLGATLLTLWAARPVQANLVAPLYPGVVPAEHEVSEQMKPYVRVFYSQDPIEKVRDFYSAHAGTLEKARSGQEFFHIAAKVPVREKASLEPGEVGVFISTPRPQKAQKSEGATGGVPAGMPAELKGADQRCLHSDFFAPLRTMAMQLEHRDWPQFNAVCEQYHHLTWSMFFPTEELDQRGRPMRMDKVLISRYRPGGVQASPEMANVSPQELAAKMQALAMSGRREEAKALAEQFAAAQMSGAVGGAGVRIQKGGIADDWEDWVKLLEEIDGHAYRTKILIHTDPATWPERPKGGRQDSHGKG